MPSVIVVGAQWGDEGKGKVIDILTSHAQHIVRAQGGNNAGHTILIDDQEYKLHLIPSGILHPSTQCYISAGTVIDPEVLVFEMNTLKSRGIELAHRLLISPAAHVIFPYHRKIDLLQEKKKGKTAIGTTGRGIGPCYADKAQRIGIRICDLLKPDSFRQRLETVLQIKNEELTKLYDFPPLSFDEIFTEYSRYMEHLRPHIGNVEELVENAIDKDENVLFEGAQGTFLDITYGTYPYVTSSSTISGGVCMGAGVGPTRISHTMGVIKAYTTRVGQGPFPTEVQEGEEFLDHSLAREFGTTTRRKRRIGWFDAVLAKTAAKLNGLDSLAVTKLDILDKVSTIKLCVGYEIEGKKIERIPYLQEELEKIIPLYETLPGWEASTKEVRSYQDLPEQAKNFLQKIESLTQVPISMVSVGPERDQTIMLQDIFSAKENV